MTEILEIIPIVIPIDKLTLSGSVWTSITITSNLNFSFKYRNRFRRTPTTAICVRGKSIIFWNRATGRRSLWLGIMKIPVRHDPKLKEYESVSGIEDRSWLLLSVSTDWNKTQMRNKTLDMMSFELEL